MQCNQHAADFLHGNRVPDGESQRCHAKIPGRPKWTGGYSSICAGVGSQRLRRLCDRGGIFSWWPEDLSAATSELLDELFGGPNVWTKCLSRALARL